MVKSEVEASYKTMDKHQIILGPGSFALFCTDSLLLRDLG